MYYPNFNQPNSFYSFSEKELIHNGNRYDATLFIEKSEVAKKKFQNSNTFSFEDGITEQVFETFFCLAVGQVRQCPPEFIPNILDLASKWKCNNVEPEIERQILEYPNPNLIFRVLLESPHNSFPTLYQFIYNNLGNFIKNPNLYELPVTSLGRIFYQNNNQINSNFSMNGPLLQGNNYKDMTLQLINKRRDDEERHKEMKKIEAIKFDQIQNLKIKNDKLLSDKKNLLIQRKNLEKQNSFLSTQIEGKKEKIQFIELQTQKDVKYADEIRNQIQKLRKEVSKKEQIQKEILEFKKRNRQSRK
ncbi:hypothetical protein M9Y10_043154 [Tritrichomonas musculus]|uniref:Uncharacterized protein n=1 Tax=Tritrichomonas musculus TaxID=1915356 RepID=A0ABR2JYW5_9EUKA